MRLRIPDLRTAARASPIRETTCFGFRDPLAGVDEELRRQKTAHRNAKQRLKLFRRHRNVDLVFGGDTVGPFACFLDIDQRADVAVATLALPALAYSQYAGQLVELAAGCKLDRFAVGDDDLHDKDRVVAVIDDQPRLRWPKPHKRHALAQLSAT